MYSRVQVGGESGETPSEVLHRWGEGVRSLILELEFLRRVRAEKARELELAEQLFRVSKEELVDIKIKARLEGKRRRNQCSLGFSSGKSLFCTQ